ncbi:hypothetical protein H0H92_004658 [Tricholoma furcatifolium]|nr:hypothetical protein H0H92_004658 [Tricholoma furcatifolium]
MPRTFDLTMEAVIVKAAFLLERSFLKNTGFRANYTDTIQPTIPVLWWMTGHSLYELNLHICDSKGVDRSQDSNGLGWSPDEKTLIYAYDYDDGNLSNRRLFVDAIAMGMPEDSFCDGLCVDSEGGIWSARLQLSFHDVVSSADGCFRWGGSRILRFTKDGAIDAEIVVPTALNVTACCFGGLLLGVLEYD